MIVLGIETSCDDSSAAVVKDGREILSNVVATQIDYHRMYNGVVPEIASRLHTEWILPVVNEALETAGVGVGDIDAVAVTSRPGLVGSLLVGLSFAKAFAYGAGIPFLGVNHIKAHLYAAHLENDIEYPYIGLLVSGGHTIICRVNNFDDIEIMGTTIDDAVGEAFDKVSKFYDFGYPGGVAIDELAKGGDDSAYKFPGPNLHKGDHRYDVSYSGLKNAAINQTHQFQVKENPTPADLAASFQRVAVGILLKRLRKAVDDTGLKRIVVGGGVAANSRIRAELATWKDTQIIFPSLKLCTDNGAMIAGLGGKYLERGDYSEYDLNAKPRVSSFRRKYPISKQG
ncbi:MAG: tRNA (adenosine(37)-N6)-threonylcarbamoyltransferase complex transferase subunit TsaD [Spirochaetales bacterium]|nr:tRNA (adenosine(37)-N6)-threonylcarbamoyltransferase complex transferase subunit TsaD [Spirochaetales bacterium]